MERADYSETANRFKPQARPKIPTEQVDQLADELVAQYHNSGYRAWYCKLIYTLGEPTVRELMGRASDGKTPAKLFSKLAAEAMRSANARSP